MHSVMKRSCVSFWLHLNKIKPVVIKNYLIAELNELWGFRPPRMKYFDGFAMVNSLKGEIGSWTADRYETTIYVPNSQVIDKIFNWFPTIFGRSLVANFHYLATEEIRVVTRCISPHKSTPGLFLAEQLIRNLQEIIPHVANEIIQEYAILCWIPGSTLKRRLEELNEKKRPSWSHPAHKMINP